MKQNYIFFLFAFFLSIPSVIIAQPEDTSNQIIHNHDHEAAMDEAGEAGEIIILVAEAKADIKGTAEGSPISGEVYLKQTASGIIVEAEVNNVPNPGKHGFHIHEFGSCAELGKAAGGHYNPMSAQHGLLHKDGSTGAHAGDMGNIEIDENGHGVYTGFLPGISLSGGSYNVSGLSVILHEKEDDFGQPTGNAGGRIGCGIISVPTPIEEQ